MKILEFLEDDNGDFSATRLALLLWVVGVLIVWIKGSWGQPTAMAIPDTVVTLVGILMGGKAIQKFGEKPAGVSSEKSAAASNARVASGATKEIADRLISATTNGKNEVQPVTQPRELVHQEGAIR